MSRVGVVVIGRNPGPRLRDSLASVIGRAGPVVYVDSGSSDGSAAAARELGAEVVELDRSSPFTAARGRNAGLAHLDDRADLVQFVDGDTTIEAGWLDAAAAAIDADAKLGVVCGRLVEKDRDSSVYRRLSGMEWHGPVGEIAACGGIAMMRAAVVREVGGYNGGLAAGEEAELCGRIRRAGYRIVRLDQPMGEHDSGVASLGAWWTRIVRVGRAYAEAATRRGEGREREKVKRVRSAVLYAGVMPTAALAGVVAAAWWPWALLLPAMVAFAYALLVWRVRANRVRSGFSARDASLYAWFVLFAKFPEFQGFLRHVLRG